MNTKSIFKSKTVIAQVVAVGAAFYPPVQAIIAANPTETMVVIGLVNVALRWITKGRVALFPS